MKKLEELTPKEFKKLKDSGLLKTIYSDAPENYAPVSDRPPLIINPDWSGIIRQAEGIVKSIEEDSYNEDDPHYMFEAVMVVLYGKNFFKWMNERT
jgi:hypothetical protein